MLHSTSSRQGSPLPVGSHTVWIGCAPSKRPCARRAPVIVGQTMLRGSLGPDRRRGSENPDRKPSLPSGQALLTEHVVALETLVVQHALPHRLSLPIALHCLLIMRRAGKRRFSKTIFSAISHSSCRNGGSVALFSYPRSVGRVVATSEFVRSKINMLPDPVQSRTVEHVPYGLMACELDNIVSTATGVVSPLRPLAFGVVLFAAADAKSSPTQKEDRT